jgi:hypothetical protein
MRRFRPPGTAAELFRYAAARFARTRVTWRAMPLRSWRGAAARDARPCARLTLAWGARCARAGLTPLNCAMERKSSADSPPRTPLRAARCGAAAPAARRTWGFRSSRATLACAPQTR